MENLRNLRFVKAVVMPALVATGLGVKGVIAQPVEAQESDVVCEWVAQCRRQVNGIDKNFDLQISADPMACSWLVETEKANLDPAYGILDNLESDWLKGVGFNQEADNRGYQEAVLNLDSNGAIGTIQLCNGDEDSKNYNNGPVRFVTLENGHIQIDSPDCTTGECSFNGLRIDTETGLFYE